MPNDIILDNKTGFLRNEYYSILNNEGLQELKVHLNKYNKYLSTNKKYITLKDDLFYINEYTRYMWFKDLVKNKWYISQYILNDQAINIIDKYLLYETKDAVFVFNINTTKNKYILNIYMNKTL